MGPYLASQFYRKINTFRTIVLPLLQGDVAALEDHRETLEEVVVTGGMLGAGVPRAAESHLTEVFDRVPVPPSKSLHNKRDEMDALGTAGVSMIETFIKKCGKSNFFFCKERKEKTTLK